MIKKTCCKDSVLFTSDLKLDFHLLKNYFICFNDSSLQMMKNAFCFILKGLFDLKILKLFSWLFAHVGKTAWLEMNLFPNISWNINKLLRTTQT